MTIGDKLFTKNGRLVAKRPNFNMPGSDMKNFKATNETNCIDVCSKRDDTLSCGYRSSDKWCWCKAHMANGRHHNGIDSFMLL